jgi:hypothetical protein
MILVRGLAPEITERDLHGMFDKHGRVTKVDLRRKYAYAFISYDNYRDAEEAAYWGIGRSVNGSILSTELIIF